MKINAINLRPGNAFLQDGKLMVVIKNEINQPGKGASVAQIEARDAKNGNKVSLRFRTQESVESADLYESDYSYLYDDGEVLHFMNSETYDQIEVAYDVLGDQVPFLQENMTVQIKTWDGSPISASLPQKVTLEIVEADPVVKGQTQSSSYKPAKLSNGVSTLVPPHIEAGTRVVVNTADASYVERAKD